MDNIVKITAEALIRYFHTLTVLGYKSYSEVDKLLVLTSIEELILSDLSFYITEDDYKVICKVLNCLFGSTCLIDFPLYKTYDSLIHKIKYELKPKITEDDLIRLSEEEALRKV